jgi:hypothetical protein
MCVILSGNKPAGSYHQLIPKYTKDSLQHNHRLKLEIVSLHPLASSATNLLAGSPLNILFSIVLVIENTAKIRSKALETYKY